MELLAKQLQVCTLKSKMQVTQNDSGNFASLEDAGNINNYIIIQQQYNINNYVLSSPFFPFDPQMKNLKTSFKAKIRPIVHCRILDSSRQTLNINVHREQIASKQKNLCYKV
eukprot:TRINITY_DN3280_c0_g1_i6.p2 TRINITY_DN3280_c0_g1~~TRINITY_DN3280_c0_g1_i6.p2  ORF type:complete len:112 (-),score=2.10 TRINITY_DN3280_c0_g1_i6:220-555(-)